MAERSIADIERIWTQVEGVKKLSDRVVGIGPFGIGLDALVTWVPVAGPLYSAGVGLWLIMQGVRAQASPATLLRMAGYVAADTATDTVPVAGSVVDMLFPGHLMAAKALQKHIETTHWVEERRDTDRSSGTHERHLAAARAAGKKRVVYLHD